MVLFFIADLALSLVFKLSAWCLGKTYNGIVCLVTYKSHPQKSNAHEAMSDDICTDDCVIVLSRQEYDALKQSHELHHRVASSEDELVSSSEDALLSSSK